MVSIYLSLNSTEEYEECLSGLGKKTFWLEAVLAGAKERTGKVPLEEGKIS